VHWSGREESRRRYRSSQRGADDRDGNDNQLAPPDHEARKWGQIWVIMPTGQVAAVADLRDLNNLTDDQRHVSRRAPTVRPGSREGCVRACITRHGLWFKVARADKAPVL